MRVASPLARIGLAIWLLATPGKAFAAGFETSTLTPVGDAPAEGEPFRYLLTLRNDGDSQTAVVDVDVPTSALFAGADGLPGLVFDAESRRARWEGQVVPGTTRTATLSFLAREDTGGHTVSMRVTLQPWSGAPVYLTHVAAIDSRPARAVFSLGRVGVAPAGVAVLGWLALSGLFWLVLRVVQPRSANWAPIAVMLPLAFLAYFGWLASEDVRINGLPLQTCTVVDRMLDSRTTSSSSSAGRSTTSTVYKPRIAVAYMDRGAMRVAQGFGTDSRLSNGSASSAEAMMSEYRIGGSIKCAIDDRDPRRAYVERGIGGAYLFALIPMPLLALGVWGLSSERRRRRL
ncbi:MAG TPA: hypothetical protein VMF13_21690 [Luteitalea sp.]|nr:hypothetical protein [Luteitalea sp.]